MPQNSTGAMSVVFMPSSYDTGRGFLNYKGASSFLALVSATLYVCPSQSRLGELIQSNVKKNLKEYGALIMALLLVCLVPLFAQSGGPAPVPQGAYKDSEGYGYKNAQGEWLPETAGEEDDDGSKAADFATMSQAGQMTLLNRYPDAPPKGLVRSLYEHWNGFFRARMNTYPGPPVKQN